MSQSFVGAVQNLDRSAGSGLRYLQRPSGEGAKAGNLNHARLHSSGKVILVLDAGKRLHCVCIALWLKWSYAQVGGAQVFICISHLLHVAQDA